MTTQTCIKDTSANPAPLGLVGFGLTTILLNIHNAGLYPNNSMILGMGIFVGGIAQIIAGILESKKNNTFGLTAFTAYGSFWLSLVAIWTLPALGLAEKSDETAMGFYLAIWGFFHLWHVHRDLPVEPRPAGGLRHPGRPVLAAGHR